MNGYASEMALCLLWARRFVDFCSHDEVVLVQAFDLLRLQRDCHVTPAEADVGVMTLGFREVGNLLNQSVCLGEVLDPVRPLDPVCVIENRPFRGLLVVRRGFREGQGWHATSA